MAQAAHNKKAFLDALEKSLGVVTQACMATGIPRRTVYNWLRDDPKFKADVDELSQVAVDFAESQLFQKIKKGDTIAIIFYLKTKGKARGYVEKQELDHSTLGQALPTPPPSIVFYNPEGNGSTKATGSPASQPGGDPAEL